MISKRNVPKRVFLCAFLFFGVQKQSRSTRIILITPPPVDIKGRQEHARYFAATVFYILFSWKRLFWNLIRRNLTQVCLRRYGGSTTRAHKWNHGTLCERLWDSCGGSWCKHFEYLVQFPADWRLGRKISLVRDKLSHLMKEHGCISCIWSRWRFSYLLTDCDCH